MVVGCCGVVDVTCLITVRTRGARLLGREPFLDLSLFCLFLRPVLLRFGMLSADA